MEINLLADGYLNDPDLYKDFMNDTLDFDKDYFSSESVFLNEAPDFPIYMARGSIQEKKEEFTYAIKTIMHSYIDTPREVHMSGRFWHSLMMTKRDYLMVLYEPWIKTYSNFKNIVLKPFDWENYIYKCVFAAEYIHDANLQSKADIDYHISLITNNIDMYNYILKYPLFRNSQFILNYFKAIDDLGITELMKAKIKDREDLGKDERYGRRVFQELNNNYPVKMAPFLQIEELKEEILIALSNYLNEEKMNEITTKIVDKKGQYA